MSNDKIKTKIQALLNKTEKNGASQSEAVSAFSIAQKLMEEYGVTLDDLKNHSEKSYDFSSSTAKQDFNNLSIIDKFCAQAIAKYTDTKVSNMPSFTYGKTGRRIKHSKIMYFGYSVDVELAIYIYKVCEMALEYEWKMFSVKLPKHVRAKMRTTFQVAMATKIADRLNAMKTETKSTKNDLIVLKNQIVEKKFNEQFTNQKSGPTLPVKYHNVGPVIAAGNNAGEQVKFNREVEDGPTGGVKLLS